MEFEDAKDNGSVHGRGGVLFGFNGGKGGSVPPQAPRAYEIRQASPTPVYDDNTACIEWGNNVIGGRERAKHIDIRKHFAHEVIQNGEMLLVRVPTASQLADIFTKRLQYP